MEWITTKYVKNNCVSLSINFNQTIFLSTMSAVKSIAFPSVSGLLCGQDPMPTLTHSQTLRYIPSKSVKFEACSTVTSTTDIRLVLNSLWPLSRLYINKGITHSWVTKGHIQKQRKKVNNAAWTEEKLPKSRKNKMVNKNTKNQRNSSTCFITVSSSAFSFC